MVPPYRARRGQSGWRRLWRAIWRSVALALLLLFLVIGVLRLLPPPTSGFMIEAHVQAWREGRRLDIQHVWVPSTCLRDSSRLAVIAAEDQKFAGHWGFDFDQIANALAEARRGEGLRGASTITQQTARNLFLWSGQSWVRKGLEAGLTLLLEVAWTKRRILEVYLNVAEFGPGVYGVEAAARRFFDKPAHRLEAGESALLAAVLPSPRRFDASNPSAYVRERQRWILGQMPRVRQLPGTSSLLEGEARCAPGH